MNRIRSRGILSLLALSLVAASFAPSLLAQQNAAPQKPAAAPQTAAQPSPSAPSAPKTPKPIELEDIVAWKGLGASAISEDGQWISYRVSPLQGDSDVIIRNTATDKEYKLAAGEGGGGAAGRLQ